MVTLNLRPNERGKTERHHVPVANETPPSSLELDGEAAAPTEPEPNTARARAQLRTWWDDAISSVTICSPHAVSNVCSSPAHP